MAASKLLFCSFFLLISSMVFVGFAQQSGGGGGGGGSGTPGPQLPCVKELLPCQPYLKQPSNPPPSCCIPMTELVTNDKQCLCQVFNNPVLLQSLNITQNDALQLTKSCGANADVSICKTMGGSPTVSPSIPATPSTSNSSSSANSPPTSAAVVLGAPFGVSAASGFLLFLLLSNMGLSI